jgi:4-diphosphocytidyl-2-C-methyl-D-erythritol kinase
MTSVSLRAYAKINLYLEVLGRGTNGFHQLETIFQSVDLFDEVEINYGGEPGLRLHCNQPDIPADERNLAWRAAAAFMAGHPSEGVAIHLRKGIPHGAGLGGGSSDAAAVLRALAHLRPHWHDESSLQRLASALGSDVPFFLHGGTALGENRGELITLLPDLNPLPITICMPNVHLATPGVFQALTDAERGPRSPLGGAIWQSRVAHGEWSAEWLFNRLTAPAMRLCAEVTDLLAWCQTTGYPYLMSGSGAACFVCGHVDPPPSVRAWKTQFIPRSQYGQLVTDAAHI